ncbi:hypothetical protein [Streptomyces sp. NPDC126933]|uniref:hypothetical protein n=1 Tax=unclassified Streptomyces TaxID=2593676 RepID=UPI00364E84A0
MRAPVRLLVRLVLAAGAVEVHLRQRFPRIMWALTPHPPAHDQPFVEPHAFLDGVDAAADQLRNLVRPDNGERAA